MVQGPPVADNDRPRVEANSSAWPSSHKSARDPDVRPDFRFGGRPLEETTAPFAARQQRSIGGRMFRAVTRFVMAVLIGVGATLGWQTYGDAATEMLATQVPTLAYVLSVLPTKQPVTAAVAAAHAPQAEPLAADLNAMRQSVDQLAARQDQMTHRIAALQAVEEDIRQRISMMPQPAAAPPQAAAVPPQKLPPPKAQPQAAQTSSPSVPRTPAAAPLAVAR